MMLRILGYVHRPERRRHRWRCQTCSKLIADGSDVIVEKRAHGSHGYHVACFSGEGAEAALLRHVERQGKLPDWAANLRLGKQFHEHATVLRARWKEKRRYTQRSLDALRDREEIE